ncbi:hypothetical protein [Nocardia sp. NPDC050413]|uniref:hypothetical protein n=1 Tax=Nocardia sp. NPDC050413 TaxID=3155784 RepID=UPI0033CFAC64
MPGRAATLGFHHAYYVTHSAEHARRFLAPELGNSITGARLQVGIDVVSANTSHCTRILLQDNSGGVDRWAVEVTEYRPGTDLDTTVYAQTVTTHTRDGVTLIAAIARAWPRTIEELALAQRTFALLAAQAAYGEDARTILDRATHATT